MIMIINDYDDDHNDDNDDHDDDNDDDDISYSYVMDRIIHHLSMDIVTGKVEGVAPVLDKNALGNIRRVLEERILSAKLEEHFQGGCGSWAFA